jgi:hypothetical protein
LELFASELSAATGEKVTPRALSRGTTTPTDNEILVGLTPRDESRAAAAEIEGDGFIIKVTKNKIVILGTDNLFTLMGLQYFSKKYLNDHEKGTPFTLHETALASSLETVVLADSAKNATTDAADVYTYVIKHGLASLPNAYAATNSSSASNTYEEYPHIAQKSICEKAQTLSGLGGKFFPTDTDKKDHEKEGQSPHHRAGEEIAKGGDPFGGTALCNEGGSPEKGGKKQHTATQKGFFHV